jgi:hypothetical protein
LPVADVYPQQIPDLFGAKPVVLTGRFTHAGAGVLRLKGKISGRDFVREIPVEFPEAQAQHDVLATLWARTRVDDLMSQDYNGLQQGNMRDDLKQTITQLGLEYRLMTQFTSFVAVEEMIVTDGGKPRRIDVPVEVPEGVSRQGVFGAELNPSQIQSSPMNARSYGQFAILGGTANVVTKSESKSKARRSGTGSGSGVGSGRGGNVGGAARSAGGGDAGGAPSPSPPNAAMTVTVVADAATPARPLSPEEEKRQRLLTKLNPSILAVIERLKNKDAKPGGDEAKFIRDSKAEIQIWLNDKSEETLAELKKLGFEVVLDPKTAKLVIGRLPIDKLGALTELKFVRYVAPQMSSN